MIVLDHFGAPGGLAACARPGAPGRLQGGFRARPKGVRNVFKTIALEHVLGSGATLGHIFDDGRKKLRSVIVVDLFPRPTRLQRSTPGGSHPERV